MAEPNFHGHSPCRARQSSREPFGDGYRGVTMIGVKGMLQLWVRGAKNERIAAQLTIDIKTVRRGVAAAQCSTRYSLRSSRRVRRRRSG